MIDPINPPPGSLGMSIACSRIVSITTTSSVATPAATSHAPNHLPTLAMSETHWISSHLGGYSAHARGQARRSTRGDLMRQPRHLPALALGSALTLLSVSACMEPQPAPTLPERPSTEFRVDTLAEGLDKPWSVAPLPDGGALITEKPGTVKRLSPDGGLTTLTGGPTPYYVDDPQSQAGLFDVVLAPDFEASNRIFLSSAVGTPEDNATALFAATLREDRIIGLTEIFRATSKDTNAHYGAKIVAHPDGTVFLTTGDAFTLREEAQSADSTLGKVVRVGADGAIPSDNPELGDGTGPTAVWSLGHRNVQGLALDPATGELWEHEHGPRGGDELNLIAVGANYGWPIVTAGTDYNGLRISPFETSAEAGGGFTDPVHGWTPSIAASGLVIYRGDLFPEWQGDALVGALAGRSLRRIDLEDGASVGEEKLLADLDARIRDVREAPDGSVWILTNEDNSRLLRLAPK